MTVSINTPERLVFEDDDGFTYLRLMREGESIIVASFSEPELTPENQRVLAAWLTTQESA